MFLSLFSPFWIAYSALLKIALMQDRYDPSKVKNKNCCQKFLMMGFLTCFGTVLLLISKLVMAIGEVLALLTYLTFSRSRVSRVRSVFDNLSSFIVIEIDQFTFDGIQQLQYNSLIFF
jgi:hypothetical protein